MSSREIVAKEVIEQNVAGMLKDGDCLCPIHTGHFFFILGLVIARIDLEVGRTLEEALTVPHENEAIEVAGWAGVDQMVAHLREELKV